MMTRRLISGHFLALITIIMLLVTNIVVVARWTGITEQRLVSLEQSQQRMEQAIGVLSSSMNQHLQLSISGGR